MRLSPAHPFAQEDTTDLAAFDRDAHLFGGLGQRIEAPLRRALLIAGHHRPIPLCHQPPWGRLTHQRDDLAVIGGCQSTATSRFRSISQPLNAFRIEAMQPTPHRLRTAMQFLRNRFDPLAIPATRYHACVHNPIGWPVPTHCQFAHPPLFFFILGGSHL